MRKTPTILCEILCSVCGNISTYQRSTSKKKSMLEVNPHWCINCKKDTYHFIIYDKEYAYNYLNNKIKLSEIEEYVLKLLENKKDENKILYKKNEYFK